MDAYSKPYWERLKQLKYDFIEGDIASAVAIALRFTLSVKGKHTAIVGTQNPARYQQNAEVVAERLLANDEYEGIRAQWKVIVKADWIGQV